MTTPIKAVTSALLLLLAPIGSWAASLEVNIGFDGSGFIIHQEVKSIQEIQRRNVVMQERDYSCGSAALATLFNYYLRDQVEEPEIINTLLKLNEEKGTLEKVIERKGFSLLDLKYFAEHRNFKATGFRLGFEDLVKLGVPAIVPIIPRGYKHFVVFRGADKDRVFMADPSIGNISQPIEQFKKDWYGFANVALVVIPPGGEKPDGHPLSLSDMDLLFIGQDDVSSILDRPEPFIFLNPGEF